MNNRRFCILLTLTAFLSSCDKSPASSSEEVFDTHPRWTEDSSGNFWDKGHEDGLRIDTAWIDDTIIYF